MKGCVRNLDFSYNILVSEIEPHEARMCELHPQFMLAKQFPVHAAIETLDFVTLEELLGKEGSFHVRRKLPNSEVETQVKGCNSVIAQFCR